MNPDQLSTTIHSRSLPLVRRFANGDVVTWRNGAAIYYEDFLGHVAALQAQLPQADRVINLVGDRYYFMVAFLATLLHQQVNLLPPNQIENIIMDIAARNPGCYVLTDQELHLPGIEIHRLQQPLATASADVLELSIPADQLAAIAFTSGSTGVPKANPKTWGCLVTGAEMAHCRFWGEDDQRASIVATVPQQHMYGLEITIMQPLQCGFAIHSGRPFYPEDVKRALEEVPSPRVLVTTPLHIKACVNQGIRFPSIHHVISATAPLSKELAQQAEECFQTKVLEIYGCTEAGSIATRRTIDDGLWSAYDQMRLYKEGDQTLVDVPGLDQPVVLGDFVELDNEREFSIHGRVTDLINIAGKRTSLGDLNHKLNKIPGVRDGAFLMPDEGSDEVRRLIAFVVAPDLDKGDIINALRQHVDPIFLPRPLYMVNSLPRTDSSKLPRERLLKLAQQMASKT